MLKGKTIFAGSCFFLKFIFENSIKATVMKINNNSEIPANEVQMEGADKVRMRILIGPGDGSDNIIMRHFIVAPGGNTPFHNHNYEHVIKVEKGLGIAVDRDGVEHQVKEGQSLFVKPGDLHQFKNPYYRDFEFLCIIPNPEKLK
jgi:quercetin dioxygenase-like cupin family protein